MSIVSEYLTQRKEWIRNVNGMKCIRCMKLLSDGAYYEFTKGWSYCYCCVSEHKDQCTEKDERITTSTWSTSNWITTTHCNKCGIFLDRKFKI